MLGNVVVVKSIDSFDPWEMSVHTIPNLFFLWWRSYFSCKSRKTGNFLKYSSSINWIHPAYFILLKIFLLQRNCEMVRYFSHNCQQYSPVLSTRCPVCPGPAAHQALVQHPAGWLSLGGQLPPVQPRPQREGGTPLLPGTAHWNQGCVCTWNDCTLTHWDAN